MGRVTAQGQTLNNFNNYLSVEFAKYIKNPQVVVYLTPRPTYVIQHDIKKNTWDVKEAKSIDEAKALAGRNYTGQISNGDIVPVEVGQKPDWWEDNCLPRARPKAESRGVFRRSLSKAMIELDALAIKKVLDAFPDCLDARAKKIIEMRYGLNGNLKKTMQQIGEIFGVSRERIRQLEKRALRKLKHPSRINAVKACA